MKKGDLVRLDVNKCFTMKQGGKRTFPLSNYANDTAGTVEATRLATDEDVSAWYDSDASKGMTSAGETKLPPTAYTVRLHRDRVYMLLRARCRPSWSYRSHPGMALVLCTESGREAYVKRELLEVAT
jgi:hypothetical protein